MSILQFQLSNRSPLLVSEHRIGQQPESEVDYMTPEAFIAKWSETTTKERAAAQEHFIDLCRVLDEKTPHEADPAGEELPLE